MGELLVALLQLAEVLLEVLANVPLDLFTEKRAKFAPPSPFVTRLLWFMAGLIVGSLSLLVFSRTLIPPGSARILNLGLAPFASGLLSQAIARHRVPDDAGTVPRDHFWRAGCFTFGLVLMRFAYVSHG